MHGVASQNMSNPAASEFSCLPGSLRLKIEHRGTQFHGNPTKGEEHADAVHEPARIFEG